MKRIQVNHSKVDEVVLKEIKRYLLPAWQKYMLLLTVMVALFVSLMLITAGESIQAIVLLVLGGICLVEVMWLSQQKLKKILKTMIEETDKEFNIYSLIFGEDALTIRNCDMATDNKMPYDTMKRIVESETAYTLFGKGSQFAVIRKDNLKIKKEELINFLKSKPTKINKWPK